MKKALSLILTVAMALSMALTAFATVDIQNNTEGQALDLEAKYIKTAPKMDGKINADEYHAMTFADYSKYFNWTKGSQRSETLEDVEKYLKNDMKIYMGWNGNDFYVALQAKAPKAEYNCEFSGNELYMFRAWSFQVAITDIEATGQDRAEVGIGFDPASGGKMISYTKWGTRKNLTLTAGENYAANWDKDAELVTYEMKLDLASILGGKAQNDSLFRLGFCLNMGDGDIATDDRQKQVELGYGIAVSKQVENLPAIALTGKSASDGDVDVDIPVDTEPQEEEQAGFNAADRFDKAGAAAIFNITNGSLEAKDMDENGEKFVRLTVTGENPIIGSKDLTQGLNMDPESVNPQGVYLAIKYRTASQKSNRFAINFTNPIAPTLNRENDCDLGFGLANDGEWHTLVFEMSLYENWTQFITEFYLCPFFIAEEDLTGETFDIQWIKYYSDPPVFEDEEYTKIDLEGNGDETVAETEAPAEDTEAVTDAETKIDATTTAGDANKNDDEGGLSVGAIIGIVAAVVVVAAGAVLVVMKKKKA